MVGLAAQNNLQVRVAQRVVEFTGQEIKRSRAAHLPTLDAFGNFSSSGVGAGIQGGRRMTRKTRFSAFSSRCPIDIDPALVRARVRRGE